MPQSPQDESAYPEGMMPQIFLHYVRPRPEKRAKSGRSICEEKTENDEV